MPILVLPLLLTGRPIESRSIEIRRGFAVAFLPALEEKKIRLVVARREFDPMWACVVSGEFSAFKYVLMGPWLYTVAALPVCLH